MTKSEHASALASLEAATATTKDARGDHLLGRRIYDICCFVKELRP